MSFATKNSQNRSKEGNFGTAKLRQSDIFAKINPQTANFGPDMVYLVIFRKMSWLMLAFGLWWVLLSKTVKTDPKSEIWVRQNSGKVIVLPKITQKRPILALKWYIWSFLEKWAGSRFLIGYDEFCYQKQSKQIPRVKFGCGEAQVKW